MQCAPLISTVTTSVIPPKNKATFPVVLPNDGYVSANLPLTSNPGYTARLSGSEKRNLCAGILPSRAGCSLRQATAAYPNAASPNRFATAFQPQPHQLADRAANVGQVGSNPQFEQLMRYLLPWLMQSPVKLWLTGAFQPTLFGPAQYRVGPQDSTSERERN